MEVARSSLARSCCRLPRHRRVHLDGKLVNRERARSTKPPQVLERTELSTFDVELKHRDMDHWRRRLARRRRPPPPIKQQIAEGHQRPLTPTRLQHRVPPRWHASTSNVAVVDSAANANTRVEDRTVSVEGRRGERTAGSRRLEGHHARVITRAL